MIRPSRNPRLTPRETDTIVVENRAQATILVCEMRGQLSDGRWENSNPMDHWRRPCDAMVFVSSEIGQPVGKNWEHARGYNFGEKDLVEQLSFRMVQYVRFALAFPAIPVEVIDRYESEIEGVGINGTVPEWMTKDKSRVYVHRVLGMTPAEMKARMDAVSYDAKDCQRDCSRLTTCFRSHTDFTGDRSAYDEVEAVWLASNVVEPADERIDGPAFVPAAGKFGYAPTVAKASRTWDVLGGSYARSTGEPVGSTRVERIDTNNSLFAACETIMDVKAKYEWFWNELNPDSEEVVFVHQITPV